MVELASAYSRIRQYVFALISSAGSEDDIGTRLTTEKELCEQFGVSRGTVRKALQMLVDEGLLVRRPHHGTFIHPSIFHGVFHRKLLGVIMLDGEAAFWDDYSMALMQGTMKGCFGTDFQLRNINFLGDARKTIHLLPANRLAGVIWLAPLESCRESFAELLKLKIPVNAVIPRWNIKEKASTFNIDFAGYAEMVTERLLQLGHRNFVFLDPAANGPRLAKEEGVRRTLTRHQLQYSEEMVRQVSPLNLPEQLEYIHLRNPEVTALVLPTQYYEMADRVYHDRPEALIIGPDIAGISRERARMPFRIQIPVAELAETATRRMIADLNAGKWTETKVLLKPEFV